MILAALMSRRIIGVNRAQKDLDGRVVTRISTANPVSFRGTSLRDDERCLIVNCLDLFLVSKACSFAQMFIHSFICS